MRAKKLTFLAGAGVLAGVSAVTSKPPKKLKVASTTWRGLIDSHEKFSHDSIDHLGYDWERVGDPNVKPKHPFKVYIPRSTEDVVEAVKEVKELGQKLTVRSKGHSSNDLVLSDHGAVLLMQAMDNIVDVDEDGLTATVQGGAISALVDDHLAPMGLGLPVIGDHKDITVGGFASVGGISPGSHRFGMFIDNVLAIEFVDWDGNVKWCSKEENSEDYYTLLAGLGKHGVMTQLKLRLIKIDKYTTIWFNDQKHFRTMDEFIAGTKPIIEEPGDAMMERGVWADFALPGGKNFRLGQFSIYKETDQTAVHKARNNVSYGVLHSMGLAAGNLPDKLDRVLKYVSITGVMASPKYASIKNIEFFTDKILDSTVGDPTRMLIVLGPLDRYEELFRSLLGAVRALPGRARRLQVHLGLRQEHPLGLPGPRRLQPVLRADVLRRHQAREHDERADGRDRRAVRRHRDRQQRLQVHAHAHVQGPGEAREGRPEPPPRGAPPPRRRQRVQRRESGRRFARAGGLAQARKARQWHSNARSRSTRSRASRT